MKTLFLTKTNCRVVGKEVFSINDMSIGYLNEENMKLYSYLGPYTKVNFELIMAINMKGKSIKPLGKRKIIFFFSNLI